MSIKLICGRSRAGKTTYCERYPKVFHLDHGGYETMLRKASESDGDVVVEGVYDTAERRMELLNAYKGGGNKVCIFLNTPLDVIESRFLPRWKPRNLPHPFEQPTLDEGWDEIVVINGGDHGK